MSGRIRTVKPEWLDDEKLGAASDAARMLSVGLMLLADDYGRGRAHPSFIASRVWAYGDPHETLMKVDGALSELATLGFVSLYEVSGQRYFAIVHWDRHQKVQHPGKPRVPAPPGAEKLAEKAPVSSARETLMKDARDPRASLTPDPDLRPPTIDQRPGTSRAPAREGSSPRVLRDPMQPAADRPDVVELHDAWKDACGFPNHRFRGAYDPDAGILADAIQAYGLADCLLVASHATSDGMVSGKADERGRKHDTIRYIFGNADAFNRILRAAQETQGSNRRKRTAADVVEEAKAL